MCARPSPPQAHRQAGFTLFEITISVVLLGLLGVVGSTMISSSVITTQLQSRNQQTYASARYAMERMRRDIREIAFDTDSGNVSITVMNTSQLVFDKSGPAGLSPISLNYSGSTLTLTTAAGSGILASELSAFALDYLDASGQSTPNANDVRAIRVAMTISAPQAQTLSLSTTIALRNP